MADVPRGEMVNALTVDVEDYYQVSAFEKVIDRADWQRLESRVERNTEALLALFDEHRVRATFFTLGGVAERFPNLVRSVVRNGHELASHGYDHTRVTQMDVTAFRKDVTDTKHMLEDIGGVAVRGYRAPTFSITADNSWAFPVLRDAGYEYSSSIYPVKHDLYGWPSAPRFAFRHRDCDLLEVPVTTVRLFNRNFPCGGGGYFRLYPYAFMRVLLRHVNSADRQPCVFYMHPWEIDAEQPRQTGLGWKTRFRHYLNLHRMQNRLHRLLNDFRWDTMAEVYGRELAVSPNQAKPDGRKSVSPTLEGRA